MPLHFAARQVSAHPRTPLSLFVYRSIIDLQITVDGLSICIDPYIAVDGGRRGGVVPLHFAARQV